MNRERLFSVTMTEEELRMFSEFVEYQKEFGSFRNRIDELNEAYEERQRVRGDREKTEEFGSNYLFPILQAQDDDQASDRMKKAYRELRGHHRLAGKYIKRVDPELQDLKRRADEGGFNDTVRVIGKATKHLGNLEDIYQTEEKLKRTKYDDRYSAKGIERLVGRKIDADEAKNIVNNRSNLNDSYKKENGVILRSEKGLRGEIGRRWDDAKMVYGEALDGRSLGKDAALAAGGAAALGLGIHAIRKHNKKKKASKDKIESKYKTKK